jgi:hypothetical protein
VGGGGGGKGAKIFNMYVRGFVVHF